MVITVDGPAAAGKSTASRMLAARLGFTYLDTGAMYRAATWQALEAGADMEDPEELARIVSNCTIELKPGDGATRVLCDGRDVTEQIREERVARNVYHLADQPAVRERLIQQQKQFACGRDVVAEGRDQGTEVFPDAAVKFFLDASVQERARRRMREMGTDEDCWTVERVEEVIQERDRHDRSRPMGGLRRTHDMVVIDSTQMTVDAVVRTMLEEIEQRGLLRESDSAGLRD